jgi:2-polyprenyl-3-methyl-5-hydroxy-6-metoxy-1,4-benzoquinol methylase
MNDRLQTSWNAMTAERADAYLRTHGAPAPGSRLLTVEVIGELCPGPVRVLDVGCGNGQMLELMRERGLDCDYTGVDFSEVLLDAARRHHAGDARATFIADDVTTMERVVGGFDVALFSHVVEMLGCPEGALARAHELARHTVIRFFEPPVHELDVTELREMEIGDGTTVPYLRRKIARDSYRLMLARLGCTAVDVYHDDGSTDQVHVLRYD